MKISEKVFYVFFTLLVFFLSIKGERINAEFYPPAKNLPGIIGILIKISWVASIGFAISLVLLSWKSTYKFKMSNVYTLFCCLFVFLKIWFDFQDLFSGKEEVMIVIKFIVIILFHFFLPMSLYRIATREARSFDRLLKSTVIASFMFSLASFIVFLQDPIHAFWNGRYIGAACHPIVSGMIYSTSAITTSYLFVRSDKGYQKIFYIFSTILFFSLSFLTGSRTILVVLLVGAGALIFTLLKTKMLYLITPVAIISMALFFTVDFKKLSQTNRTFSVQDTRSEALKTMINSFLDNPVFGANKTLKTENSVLLYLSRSGLVGAFVAIPFFCLLLYFYLDCFSYALIISNNHIAAYSFTILNLMAVIGMLSGVFLDIASTGSILIHLSLIGYFVCEGIRRGKMSFLKNAGISN